MPINILKTGYYLGPMQFMSSAIKISLHQLKANNFF